MKNLAITPEQITPEVISAMEDALRFHLGDDLINQADATLHQIAVECLRQIVPASYPGTRRRGAETTDDGAPFSDVSE